MKFKIVDKLIYNDVIVVFHSYLVKFFSWLLHIKQKPAIFNINRDFTQKQPRVLLLYVVDALYNVSKVYHPSYIRCLQMITCLIEKGCVVDYCGCNNLNELYKLYTYKYDYIIGFGAVYTKMCEHNLKAKKILYLTENDPKIVKEKFLQRLEYFHERHPHVKVKIKERKGFYNLKMFSISDIALIQNSEYNSTFIRPMFKQSYNINVTGLLNPSFVFKIKDFTLIKNNFVWFGSVGAIHKGLDILVDAFSMQQRAHLHIYGLVDIERKLFKKVHVDTITIHDKIDVNSLAFINEVINRNTFIFFPSCSEGMASGVATCMLHGLIPIVTRECGYNAHPCIIELKNYTVEYILEMIEFLTKRPLSWYERMSKEVYTYANTQFTISHFRKQFGEILDNILS